MRAGFLLLRARRSSSAPSMFGGSADASTTLDVDVMPAPEAKPIVDMMQRYLVELTQGEVTSYPQLSLYWTQRAHLPFLIRVRGETAGFALVRDHEASGFRELAEFYVIAAQRRRGVGSHAAALLFARFPGSWRLNVFRENRPAQRFWRKVVPTPLVESAEATADGRRYTAFQFLSDGRIA